MKPPTVSGFLVRLPAKGGVGLAAPASALKALGARFELEPLFSVRATSAPAGAGLAAAGSRWTWHIARPVRTADLPNPWDVAHALQSKAGLAAGVPVLVKPDLNQEWPYENPIVRGDGAPLAAADVLRLQRSERRPADRCGTSSRGISGTTARSFAGRVSR